MAERVEMTTVDVVPLDDAQLPYLEVLTEEYTRDPWGCIDRIRRSSGPGAHLFRSERGIDVVAYDAGREILSDRRLTVHGAAHWEKLGAGPLLMEYLTVGKMTQMVGLQHATHRRMLG